MLLEIFFGSSNHPHHSFDWKGVTPYFLPTPNGFTLHFIQVIMKNCCVFLNTDANRKIVSFFWNMIIMMFFFLRFATILTNNFNLKLQNCCALKTRKIARCIFILAISPGVTVLETKSADGWVMGQVVWDERDFFPRQVYSYVISLISKENSGL